MGKHCGRCLAGYMTVEAVGIFATALSVIVFTLFCGFFQCQRCVLELDAYYDVHRSLQIGYPVQEDVEMDIYQASVQREKGYPFWLGIHETTNLSIQVQAKMQQWRPAEVMRLCQRLKRMKDERD